MTTGEGHVVANGIQRAVGVAIGATLAVSVQLAFETIVRRLRPPQSEITQPGTSQPHPSGAPDPAPGKQDE